MTMIAATPVSEWLARRFGHRIACVVGAALLAGSLAGLAWGVDHGYAAIAVCLVVGGGALTLTDSHATEEPVL